MKGRLCIAAVTRLMEGCGQIICRGLNLIRDMKYLLLFFVAVILISGCIGDKTTQLMESYDRAATRDIAIGFVRNNFDARGMTCDILSVNSSAYHAKCVFSERGNVSANHVISMEIDSGVVQKAVLDGKTDML
jgi:hypothetical protein